MGARMKQATRFQLPELSRAEGHDDGRHTDPAIPSAPMVRDSFGVATFDNLAGEQLQADPEASPSFALSRRVISNTTVAQARASNRTGTSFLDMPGSGTGTPLPLPPSIVPSSGPFYSSTRSSRKGTRSETSRTFRNEEVPSSPGGPGCRPTTESSLQPAEGSECNDSDGDSIMPIDSYKQNSTTAEEVIAMTTHYLSVSDRSLIRGMPLTGALHAHGHIFANAVGSSRTYSLSETVGELDCFISHNWSTPRVHKFWALTFHYNLAKAVAVTLLAGALGAWMTAQGVVPYFDMGDSSSMYKFPRGLSSNILGSLLFWMTLLMGHELEHCLVAWCPFLSRGLVPKMVFLDKTCIHQTDEELKQRGVWSLGAFLVQSKKMVILYSHKYFKRIWTVYELACFVCMKKTDDCLFLATNAPQFVASGWLSVFLYFVVTTILRALVGDVEATRFITIVITIASLAGTICVRIWHREMETLSQNLRNFKLDEAACYDEKDRDVIYSGIVAFMKYRGFVTADSSEREALDCFEDLLRNSMCDKIECIVGYLGVAYEQTLIVGLPVLLVGFDTVGAKLARQDPVPETVMCFLYYIFEYLLCLPLALALLFFMAKQCLKTSSKMSEVICVAGFVVAFLLIRAAMDHVHMALVVAVAEENSTLLICLYALCILVMVFLAWLAYGSPVKRGLRVACGLRRRRSSTAPMPPGEEADPSGPMTPSVTPSNSRSWASVVAPLPSDAAVEQPQQEQAAAKTMPTEESLHSARLTAGPPTLDFERQSTLTQIQVHAPGSTEES